jgi:hypothetical protein
MRLMSVAVVIMMVAVVGKRHVVRGMGGMR